MSQDQRVNQLNMISFDKPETAASPPLEQIERFNSIQRLDQAKPEANTIQARRHLEMARKLVKKASQSGQMQKRVMLQAVSLYQKAMLSAPNLKEPYLALAYICQQGGFITEAGRLLQRARELHPFCMKTAAMLDEVTEIYHQNKAQRHLEKSESLLAEPTDAPLKEPLEKSLKTPSVPPPKPEVPSMPSPESGVEDTESETISLEPEKPDSTFSLKQRYQQLKAQLVSETKAASKYVLDMMKIRDPEALKHYEDHLDALGNSCDKIADELDALEDSGFNINALLTMYDQLENRYERFETLLALKQKQM